MSRGLGRRPLFFFFLALVGLAMVPATPGDFRGVCWFTAGLALFWAILLAVEDLWTPREEHGRRLMGTPPTPFDPPPPPGGEGR